MNLSQKAPITARERAQLRADAKNLKETAARKQVTLDAYDEAQESHLAKSNFELGCWLFYYRRRVYTDGPEGLKFRVECALRLFLSGFTNPAYGFFTVFDFGERQFDSIFEMGDGAEVVAALRRHLPQDTSKKLHKAFFYFGWPLEQYHADCISEAGDFLLEHDFGPGISMCGRNDWKALPTRDGDALCVSTLARLKAENVAAHEVIRGSLLGTMAVLDNAYDPRENAYKVPFVVMFPPASNSGRQVTITVGAGPSVAKARTEKVEIASNPAGVPTPQNDLQLSFPAM